jgi:hypothetical protein
MMEFICKDCGLVGGKDKFYAYKHQCKTCWNKRTYQAARDKLNTLIAERGGKCECCGYDKYTGALQWHHLDPTQKEFSISNRRGSPLEKLRAEVAKCKLLCANCHAEAHSI